MLNYPYEYVDPHTKKVTEGIYTFDDRDRLEKLRHLKHKRDELRKKKAKSILFAILTGAGCFMIGATLISGLVATVLKSKI